VDVDDLLEDNDEWPEDDPEFFDHLQLDN